VQCVSGDVRAGKYFCTRRPHCSLEGGWQWESSTCETLGTEVLGATCQDAEGCGVVWLAFCCQRLPFLHLGVVARSCGGGVRVLHATEFEVLTFFFFFFFKDRSVAAGDEETR
jgi:hypothetical protein